jgi:hypothetical protein
VEAPKISLSKQAAMIEFGFDGDDGESIEVVGLRVAL